MCRDLAHVRARRSTIRNPHLHRRTVLDLDRRDTWHRRITSLEMPSLEISTGPSTELLKMPEMALPTRRASPTLMLTTCTVWVPVSCDYSGSTTTPVP